MSTTTGQNLVLISQTTFEKFEINQNLSFPLFLQWYILYLWRYKMYHWRNKGNYKFWLFLNFSKVVWHINTKFLSVVVLISFQLSTKFEGHNLPKKTSMPLGSSKWKWAWRAHFLSHTYETQEICRFLADVKIILLLFFDLSYCLKVAKNAEAFLSRCSELFG